MTEIDELFSGIESLSAAAAVNVASSLALAIRVGVSLPQIHRLVELMHGGFSAQVIWARISDLVNAPFDDRYENPNDAAVFLYLLLLERSAPALARSAAEWVDDSRHWWWARKYAEVLSNPVSTTSSGENSSIALPNHAKGAAGDIRQSDTRSTPRIAPQTAVLLLHSANAAESIGHEGKTPRADVSFRSLASNSVLPTAA